MSSDPIVYDKAKYHVETVIEDGLPEDQACVHTAFFFHWILERHLYSEEFVKAEREGLADFFAGKTDGLALYKNWDCALVDDMMNAAGNGFARAYFDLTTGKQYIKDYEKILGDDSKSIYAVEFNMSNYHKLRPIIDLAYQRWLQGK